MTLALIVAASMAMITLIVMEARFDARGREWTHIDWLITKLDGSFVASGSSVRKVRPSDMPTVAGEILLEWFFDRSILESLRYSFQCQAKVKGEREWQGTAIGR
ncbi:MAG TPA: hypothetical protein VLT90_12985 [Terriglobales bacterium]|nr:hypothetical protein [Terriglobales bacterium]